MNWQDSGSSAMTAGEAAPDWRVHAMTASALRERAAAPLRYVVSGLIPEGVTLIAGARSLEKSWLMLDLALAATSDGAVLGCGSEIEGHVLHLALTDSPARLRRRMGKLLVGHFGEWPQRLTCATTWRRADRGIEDIADWCTTVARPQLVVIDSLEKISPAGKADHATLAGLRKLVACGVSIVASCGVASPGPGDVFDALGAELSGAADTIMLMRGTVDRATLHVRGRELAPRSHAVAFDAATCRWSVRGEADEVTWCDQRGRVLAALAECGDAPVADIMLAAGLPSRNAARILLHRMARGGEVRKVKYGVYALPTDGTRNSGNCEILAEETPHSQGDAGVVQN